MKRFRALFLASLPVFAAAPVSVKITHATVTWGAGVEPKGEIPPGHFEARVMLAGSKLPRHPVFRLWRTKIGDLPGREDGKAKYPPLDKATRLESKAAVSHGGTWMLQGLWRRAPEPEDRLVVEVCAGSRRLGWAMSPLTEQFIPAEGKQPGLAQDD